VAIKHVLHLAATILEDTVNTQLQTAAGPTAAEILAWSRTTVDPALRNAVAQLPASMRRVARYHFGWCDSQGKPASGDTGKAVRPALALLCAQAVGGDPEAAVPAAVAVELVHNFSLLHDDVMDRDLMRRHQPAAWTVFGAADAILAGSALLSLAFQCVAQSSGALGSEGVRRLHQSVAELCHGQSLDLSFEQRGQVEIGESWAMAAAKTGALFSCACSLGAMAAGASADQVRLLNGFGDHLGLAFQLVDDLLGIWGDPAVTGKPAHSDLMSRKKSLPAVAALNSETAPGQDVALFYQRPEPFQPGELAGIAELIERAGAREWARRAAASERTMAVESLAAADCRPHAQAALRELADLLLQRDH
jgi:geranylgeranyl diphosphate synthase type I